MRDHCVWRMRKHFSFLSLCSADENCTFLLSILSLMASLFLLSLMSSLFPCRLWKTCDLNEDGYIQFSEFLSTMGLEINPGDVGGVSQRITGANQSDGAKRRDDQKKR